MHSDGERTWPGEWQQVRANEWRSVDVPPLDGSWQPTASVSVVIPAYGTQRTLERTLAALTQQHYPSSLVQVIVADDGSSPPLTLPELAPPNTELLRLERDQEWGPGRTRHAGALAADGELLLFLDADMIAYPDHLAAHARWHHVTAEAVTLGHKRFADFDDVSPDQIAAAAGRDSLDEFAATRPHQPHDWIEAMLERTDELTKTGPTPFMAAVTATLGVRADVYREAGGFRPSLRTGEDMEFAYRLYAVGAVFIPEREARSWHQGSAAFMTRAEEIRRNNQPIFANYVPVPGLFRPWRAHRHYSVPMVDVIIETNGESFEAISATVDAVLASDETDLHVELCCAEETHDMDLARQLYAADARVRVRRDTPDSGFPSLYTVFLPDWAGLGEGTLSGLVALMERERLGVVDVRVRDAALAEGPLTVWKTGALHRARRARASSGSDETLPGIAARLFGAKSVDGGEVGVIDFSAEGLPRLPRLRPRTTPTPSEPPSAHVEPEKPQTARTRVPPQVDKDHVVTGLSRKTALIGVAAALGGGLLVVLAALIDPTAALVVLALLIAGGSALTVASVAIVHRDTKRQSRQLQRTLKGLRTSDVSPRQHGKASQQPARRPGATVQDVRKTMKKQAQRTAFRMERALYWHFKQTEALLNLHGLITVRNALPASREYTVSPDLLLAYVSEILARGPSLIVECGSGLSTLWAGYAAELCGGGVRVVALEDSEQYVQASRDLVAAHGLTEFVEIRHTPITQVNVDGEECPWYDPILLDDLKDIGILLVDGPVGALATQARYPAVPMLRERLSPGALIIVDDANREEETALVARWQEQWPELQRESLRHEKGTVFLHAPV